MTKRQHETDAGPKTKGNKRAQTAERPIRFHRRDNEKTLERKKTIRAEEEPRHDKTKNRHMQRAHLSAEDEQDSDEDHGHAEDGDELARHSRGARDGGRVRT